MKMFLLIFIIIGSSFFCFSIPILNNARAALVYPRFGSAIQGPRSPGKGYNTSNFLDQTLLIWLSPDPAESPIPHDWYNRNYWSVALLPAIMPTANCIILNVKDILIGSSPMILYGGEFDTNPLFPNAIGLICQIPADIAPLTYHLAVGFKELLSPERQLSGEINLIPQPGSWIGGLNSANALSWSATSFILTEACAVVIPWLYDPKSSDHVGKRYQNGALKPFTLMHITDTHYNSKNPLIEYYNTLWEMDARILAPDLIVLSGDVIDTPKDTPEDFALAYYKLTTLGLPFVIASGNHDQYLMGFWRHFFGPMYSHTQFDSVQIVMFDSTLPYGTGVSQWIERESKRKDPENAVFLTCHYPPDGSYLSSGIIALYNMMIQNNVTALLTGHTHSDLLADIPMTLNELIKSPSEEGLRNGLELTNQTTNYLNGINDPLLVITRSAGKSGDVLFKEGFEYANGYRGYRIFTFDNNLAYNYSYDFNGDGQREPQISYPSGLLKFTQINEDNIGISNTAGAWGILNNSRTEELTGGRALFTLPHAVNGMHWDLSQQNKTAGAYIRTSVYNATHVLIDARVTVPRNQCITLRIEPVLGGM